jgi:HAD superfamily hydrolase (TIGR01484 family)
LKPVDQIPALVKKGIRFVLTDIDDTLTVDGRLPAAALNAMERLQAAAIRVVPITGRPAGWCDHIARMWPVDGLVGENGAFYFFYDRNQRKMLRGWWKPESERLSDRQVLEALGERILKSVPGCRVSADQRYREADLAIDYREDVSPLAPEAIRRIVEIFEEAGARAKISSIHVNGWFGDYDKLAMTRRLFDEVFSEPLEEARERVIFIGDSPNDAPMFTFFPNSVGVAGVRKFLPEMKAAPRWITEKDGGFGFAEMVDILLQAR